MQTLKQLRAAKGLTRKDAAAQLGVSRDTLKRWEAAETFPTAPDIVKICRFYGTTFDKIDFEAQAEG